MRWAPFFVLFIELFQSAVAFSVATVPTSVRKKTPTGPSNTDTSITRNEAAKFFIHKGHSTTKDMIMRSPAIAGLTLVENWSDDATQSLSKAVDQIVQNNPILRGRVHTEHSQLWITTGMKSDACKQEFFRILESPSNAPDFSQITDPQQQVLALQQHVVPLFDKCELTSAQISKNLPLFQVTLVLLPGNYAAYAMHMSHAVGDGVTFFQLVKELSMLMSGLPIDHPIKWNCPAKATHEFSPPQASPRDVHFTYGPPMMLGALVNAPTLISREASFVLLEKKRVNDMKRALRATLNTTDVSANDIITSALCEACQSSDLFLFTENVRHNGGPIPVSAGGNFLIEVPVSKETASQPDKLRKVVLQHGEYEPNKLPLMPFISGRAGRITSLASIAEIVMYDGVKVICTLPLASFIAEIPLDVGVIFRYDKHHWGVLHNFAQLDPKAKLMAELLGERETGP